MKQLPLTLTAAILLLPAGAPADDEATLRHIKTVLWPQAYRTQDVDLLDELLHDSFETIDAEGRRSTKAKELEFVANNAWDPGRFEFRIERLRIYQDRFAVVDGTGVAEGYTYKSSNFLVKEDGRWQAIASHVSGVRAVGEEEPRAGVVPLLDGRCGEANGIGAASRQLAPGVELHSGQLGSAVWICVDFPDGSFGVADLDIDAPGLDEPLRLHASAQLGEWPAADQAPAEATSDRWWNNAGWVANAVRWNGNKVEAGGAPASFRRDTAREFVLDKGRFGTGEWRLSLSLSGIRDEAADGMVDIGPVPIVIEVE